jgi:hypothetical protein
MIQANDYKSADDNTIYICKDEYCEFWKLSPQLLKKSQVIPLFEDFLQVHSSLNEPGYVIVWFDDEYYENRFILEEAWKFYKIDFKFDQSTLQKFYDSLNEDEKDNLRYDSSGRFEDVGISSDYKLYFPDDLSSYLNLIFDDEEWGVYRTKSLIYEVDDTYDLDGLMYDFALSLEEYELKNKQNEKKIKQRRTKYKNMGCKILKGYDALTEIDKSYTHSMIAINTDDIYSIEFNREEYYASDYQDASIFTVRKFENGKLVKKAYWWFLLFDLIHDYEWAIKQYHSNNDQDFELCPYN